MIDNVVKIVSEIQQAEIELNKLSEENNSKGMEKLRQVFENAKHGLKFEGIPKRIKGYFTTFEEKEFFYRTSGDILKGVLLFSIDEEQTCIANEHNEEYREVYLLDDGSLKVYHTTHKWLDDNKYSKHHEVTRVEFEFDHRNFYFGWVINSILEQLAARKEHLDFYIKLMKERIETIHRITQFEEAS
ncbi:hypothetical protein M4D70_15680 [Brevibacillus borstelensis]|uniref:hypothetical protein n=1 Tax=Brevibacillus borstelensis TaxID=45462 RepID=UPI00203A419F|nr:hypothetical protein [Brevibacillus borstelensis]MCM3623674.1 hypothetical protein [Brevibacillus borstelensis]